MSLSQNLGLHKCFHESWLEIAPGGRDEAHHGCNQEQNYLTVLEPFNCGPGVAMTRVPIPVSYTHLTLPTIYSV